MLIAFALLYMLMPAVLIWLMSKQLWAQKLGAIILCYGCGLILGNTDLIPESASVIQNSVSEISIALALPILLFSLDVKQWSKIAGKAFLSMILATTSVVTLATTFFFIYSENNSTEASHLAAMSVGVYTGGTPNLAAIKAGLSISNDQYLLFHSFDVILGAIYMLLMLTVAIPFFRWLLPKPTHFGLDNNTSTHQDNNDDYTPFFKKENFNEVASISILSMIALALSVAGAEFLKWILNLSNTGAATVILLTTCGILFSLHGKIRSLHLSYKAGMYLIYIFCFCVASMADLKTIMNFDSTVAIFLFGTVIGSISLHAILCKLTNVDSDTFMATSVSAICSPPFVPMIAKALSNSSILLSGMTTGIIGYALGNYMGISLALFLQNF